MQKEFYTGGVSCRMGFIREGLAKNRESKHTSKEFHSPSRFFVVRNVESRKSHGHTRAPNHSQTSSINLSFRRSQSVAQSELKILNFRIPF